MPPLLGLVCVDTYLYAIGGYDGRTQLCSVERYSVVRDAWEPVASMRHCRSAHGVTVYQGRIFALGRSTQAGTHTIPWVPQVNSVGNRENHCLPGQCTVV